MSDTYGPHPDDFSADEFPTVSRLAHADTRDDQILRATIRYDRAKTDAERATALADALDWFTERHNSAKVTSYPEWSAIKRAADFLRSIS